MTIACPGAKSATLATLMLLEPTADADAVVVTVCNWKSLQLLSVSADHVAFAQNGKCAGESALDMAVEQARGLQLLAPQADHERLPRQVGMERDVMQGAYGHGGARRIDGHAAAIGVGDRDRSE